MKAERKDKKVALSVTDNGIGIKEEAIKQILDKKAVTPSREPVDKKAQARASAFALTLLRKTTGNSELIACPKIPETLNKSLAYSESAVYNRITFQMIYRRHKTCYQHLTWNSPSSLIINTTTLYKCCVSI